MIRHCNYKIP